jgi:hypothetical protein
MLPQANESQRGYEKKQIDAGTLLLKARNLSSALTESSEGSTQFTLAR